MTSQLTGKQHYEHAADTLAWIDHIPAGDLPRIRRQERRGRRTPLAECIAQAAVHAHLAEVALAAGLWDTVPERPGPVIVNTVAARDQESP
jgi:hypothetical protein